jgi:hypothetical protein
MQMVMVFNASFKMFSVISRLSVLLVEEASQLEYMFVLTIKVEATFSSFTIQEKFIPIQILSGFNSYIKRFKTLVFINI